MHALLAADTATGVWLSPIIVALIGGPLMVLVKMLDRHNTRQHGQNMGVLTSIRDSVDEVKSDIKGVQADIKKIEARLDHHIDWHMDHLGKDQLV